MNTKATFKLSVIFAFFTILVSEETIKYANFRTENYNAFFPFGSTVGMYCEQVTNISQVEALNVDKDIMKIVKDSQLLDEYLTTYQLEVINSTTILFTIKKLTNQINGTLFRCRNGKELSVKILGFDPIDVKALPNCTSSFPSRFIFEDSVQSDIEMNCTSEEGDPPVMMSTYFRDGDKINDVTNISTRTVSSHPHPSKTLSSSFNSSFNNSVFVCNVSQQLPPPYNQSYQGSCTFGPILFLPLFSVAVTPSRIMFNDDVKNTIFNCTSNVSEVNLTWSNIPKHWIYNINKGASYIELNVTDTGSDVYSVDIGCVGYYGNRNITSKIQIRAPINPGTVSFGDRNITSKMDYNERNHLGRVITVALVITAISLCLIFIIVIVVLYYRLNVSFCNRNPDLAKQNSSTNNANVRNATITDDVVPSMRFQTENSALDVPAMIDNTIYESYTEKNCQNQTLSETERLEKEQEIEMVENEIYESNSFSSYE